MAHCPALEKPKQGSHAGPEVNAELTSARLSWAGLSAWELACHASLTGALQVSRHLWLSASARRVPVCRVCELGPPASRGVQHKVLCPGSAGGSPGDRWHVPFPADSVWIGAAARQACSDRGTAWFRSPVALAAAPVARGRAGRAMTTCTHVRMDPAMTSGALPGLEDRPDLIGQAPAGD